MSTDIEFYRNQFYQEARDLLENVSENILKVEVDQDDESILNVIFRDIHTIKGSAGGFDLDLISEFSHNLEGLLDALRAKDISINGEIVDTVLAGVDKILEMITEYQAGNIPDLDRDLMAKFSSLYETQSSDDKPKKKQLNKLKKIKKEVSLSIPVELIRSFRQSVTLLHHIYQLKLLYTGEHLSNGFDPRVFLKALKKETELYWVDRSNNTIPELEEFNALEFYLNPKIYFASKLSIEELLDLTFDPELINIVEITEDVIKYGMDLNAEIENITTLEEVSIKEFIEGNIDGIEELEREVLEYEKTNSRASLDTIFRIIHNIKGDSDYVGLKTMSKFTHNLETLLDKLRQNTIAITPQLMDLILSSVDEIKILMRQMVNNEVIFQPKLLKQIIKYNEDYTIGERTSSTAKIISPEKGEVFIEQTNQYREILNKIFTEKLFDANHIKIVTRSLSGLVMACKFIELQDLGELAEKTKKELEKNGIESISDSVFKICNFIRDISEEPKRIGEWLLDSGKISKEDIDDALKEQRALGEILVNQGKLAEKDITDSVKKQELSKIAIQNKKTKETDLEVKTMRVDEDKLEDFSNLIGELIVARNTYDFIIEKLELLDNIPESIMKSLKSNLYQFSKVSNDMQLSIMELRMIPIKGIFRKFSRVVRDISRKQNKSIELITEGEDVEIDKKIADILSNPLIHVIRNACDHGIETPEVRKAKGKKERGKVLLSASLSGSHIMIKVSDDGKGLDKEAIIAKAKKLGMAISDDFTDEQIFDLTFLPGFSTSDSVSDISGRGVGMDVVKTTITSSLGGDVKLNSVVDKGTELIFTIPMSMGVTSSLIVDSEKTKYAFPLEVIDSTIKIEVKDLKILHDRLGFYYKGRVIPVDFLNERLFPTTEISGNNNLRKRVEKFIGDSDDKLLSILVIKNKIGTFGLIVNKFYKNIDISVKPVPPQLSSIKLINGVSIMGDGNVVLMINTDEIV